MCRFVSAIKLKNKIVIADGHDHSHSTILRKLNIGDNRSNAMRRFVRLELYPKNDEWWISPEEHPEQWMFNVDQDILPDWFNSEIAETEMRKEVYAWWKIHVMVDQKIEQLESGYYRLKRCEVKQLLSDVSVMLDSSTVNEMRGSSTVNEMWGSSTVNKMLDSSTVNEMRDSSTVNKMWDSSTVNEMRGSSTVNEMWDSSTVNEMRGSSTVSKMWDSSTVNEMRDSSTVNKMWDSSTVNEMLDRSTARDFKYYRENNKVRILIPDTPDRFELVVHENKEIGDEHI